MRVPVVVLVVVCGYRCGVGDGFAGENFIIGMTGGGGVG